MPAILKTEKLRYTYGAGTPFEIHALAGGVGSARGTGGMATKVIAAEIAASAGISTFIANGEHPEILYDIVEDKARGTMFGNEQLTMND